MKKRVLISGGSGLVGSRLSQMLLNKGYEVAHLSRTKESKNPNIDVLVWDVQQMKLDPKAIEAFDYIIHLAGAGIVDEAWTEERKKVIQDSRVKSSQLLKQSIQANEKKPLAFVSASAIGYYGIETTEHIYKESDAPGSGFLAETCVKWEASINEIEALGIPVSKIRIGLVLSPEGGALKEMAAPLKLGFGAPLGSGKQYMPWIHIDDLCRLFIYSMEQKASNTFNGAAPNPVNNQEFTKILASVLKKPLWLPNVPGFIIKMLLGSRSQLVLKGSRISAEKVLASGFQFRFTDLKSALKDLYEKA